MRALWLPSCFLLLAVPAVQAQGAGYEKPAALQWGPAPDAFAKGVRMAVVSGDPTKSEPFEVQLMMPNGYKIPPHFHPTDEVVEVKKGTFLVGMGDQFDAKKTAPMKAGDKATVPAEHHHFGMAKGKTVVDVKATGPFTMTYVNTADDPRKQSSAR
jgi:mannose-6-phosphate isomerase-like protein (cupin superfamily)